MEMLEKPNIGLCAMRSISLCNQLKLTYVLKCGGTKKSSFVRININLLERIWFYQLLIKMVVRTSTNKYKKNMIISGTRGQEVQEFSGY